MPLQLHGTGFSPLADCPLVTVLSASDTERVPRADDLRPENGKMSGPRWHWALMLTRPTLLASTCATGAAGGHGVAGRQWRGGRRAEHGPSPSARTKPHRRRAGFLGRPRRSSPPPSHLPPFRTAWRRATAARSVRGPPGSHLQRAGAHIDQGAVLGRVGGEDCSLLAECALVEVRVDVIEGGERRLRKEIERGATHQE